LESSRKLAAHDSVFPVGGAERATFVGYWCTQPFGGVLVFEFFDAMAIGVAEEEADHRVVKAAIDETICDVSEGQKTAYRLERAHVLSMEWNEAKRTSGRFPFERIART